MHKSVHEFICVLSLYKPNKYIVVHMYYIPFKGVQFQEESTQANCCNGQF